MLYFVFRIPFCFTAFKVKVKPIHVFIMYNTCRFPISESSSLSLVSPTLKTFLISLSKTFKPCVRVPVLYSSVPYTCTPNTYYRTYSLSLYTMYSTGIVTFFRLSSRESIIFHFILSIFFLPFNLFFFNTIFYVSAVWLYQ